MIIHNLPQSHVQQVYDFNAFGDLMVCEWTGVGLFIRLEICLPFVSELLGAVCALISSATRAGMKLANKLG